MANDTVHYHQSAGGQRLAYLVDGPPAAPSGTAGLFWLGGFVSDMTGSKAQVLAAFADEHGVPCTRFDYSGHGRSSGDFVDCTVSDWLAEAVEMFTEHAPGRRVVVGSSMGGWIAMLLHRALLERGDGHADRLAGMVLIAPAPDMTRALMWDQFSPDIRRTIETDGVYWQASEYGEEPYAITRKLIEDGKRHQILEEGISAAYPVRILHGEDDADVPWRHGLATYDAIAGDDVAFSLIKHGDHRLSSPRDLIRLRRVLGELCL